MFERLSEKLNDAFRNLSGRGRISESNVREAMEEVRTALLEADVNLQVVDRFASLVNPGLPIHPGATAVHGITDDDVAEAPRFLEFVAALRPRLAGVDAIVCHKEQAAIG